MALVTKHKYGVRCDDCYRLASSWSCSRVVAEEKVPPTWVRVMRAQDETPYAHYCPHCWEKGGHL